MVNKVYDKSLYVTSIMILISHDHQMSISEVFDVRLVVRGTKFEPHDVNQILDFLILDDLGMCCFADVERLALQGKHCRKNE